MRATLFAVLALTLASCGPRIDRIAAMDAEDDAACRNQRSVSYDQCRHTRLEYRKVASANSVARDARRARQAAESLTDDRDAAHSACQLAGRCW